MSHAGRKTIAFQGRRAGRSAFALVNARWSAALSDSGLYEVCDYDESSPAPDILIHHDFENAFHDFVPPAGVPSIAVRTWDFGPLPAVWVGRINDSFAQYWAHTQWIAKQARAAGVRDELIRVVPHGVDPAVFKPDGDSYPVASDKRFRFLFVGGVSLRKGTDVLLKAYGEAFTSRDDVVLILKDHSSDLFYGENSCRDIMNELRGRPDAPGIEHIDAFLSESELAALYRSADVGVFPYRAEGFCIPILECMACGTPPIVPRFGACLDYCDDSSTFLVTPQRIHIPVNRRFAVALGFTDEVEEVDFCEVKVSVLAEAMRTAYECGDAVRRAKAQAGVRVAHGRFTWSHATSAVLQHLAELT